MSIEERIKALKEQQEQAREVFVKCQGAIEVLEGMLQEEGQEVSQEEND